MTVCVTGAEGFIGSHLVEKLVRQGHNVKALVQYNSFGSAGWLEDIVGHENLEIMFGDIRDPGHMAAFVQGAETVVHLAALIAIPHSYNAPHSYIETNILGTLNLLNASKQVNLKKFIHTSTSEVYGTAQKVPISEDHPLQPQSPYSASKIGADALAHSYFSSFGMPVTILRPFNTYGPRQSMRAVIPTILTQALLEGTTISLGSLEPTRDFTFVEDTVDGFVAAMYSEGIEGQTFNLGTGFEISIGGLVKIVEEIVGREINIEPDQQRLRPDASEVQRLLSDNKKAKTILSWEPKLVGPEGLKLGLSRTLEWLRPMVQSGKYRARSYVL